ncbi:MAG: substrate-binding domain-containing protein [Hyphomicrobiales bacterium]|nr:substrate-binding domain-containing protein [Hyphomicrobiales bacterium]
MKLRLAAGLAALTIGGAILGGPGAAKAQTIQIVGSSTVYPFTAKVAEKLEERGIDVDLKSTGTGAGFNLFCLGYGNFWPDVTGASRPMRAMERQICARRGVTEITEIKVGYDGIVVASSNAGATVDLSLEDLFLALAERIIGGDELVPNPNTKWSDVNSDFPETEILVYGPPPSSGTRAVFQSLAMAEGCEKVGINKVALEEIEDLAYCKTLRGAPHFIEGGEDDDQLVQVLKENADAFGVFGYSFAFSNADDIHANSIDGVDATPETISNGSYPLSRPLYLYVKNNRIAEVETLKDFLTEYMSDAAMGPDGYLVEAGLIRLPEGEIAESRAAAQKLVGAATN